MDYLALLNQGSVTTSFFDQNKPLPLVITDTSNSISLIEWASNNSEVIKQCVFKYGAVLCRGFVVKSHKDFERYIRLTSAGALPYHERSSPRDQVEGNIYTSTSQRADQSIFLHNEQSYNLNFSRNIYFYCEVPAAVGGETPLADTRKILERIPEPLKLKLVEKGYQYQRNFSELFGLTWQEAYQTRDRNEVESYCTQNDIQFEWADGDIELRTRQKRAVIAIHPFTKERCWFNHCTFFNFKTLSEQVQSSLSAIFDMKNVPNQTCFGDGTPFSHSEIIQLQQAYLAEKVSFKWESSDVLMVDNMLSSHGREPFQGNRRVLTGLSEPTLWSDVQDKEMMVLEI
ncbi:taurine catabolism dioxygenase TauD [Pseudoalteromonas maricaloris]|uniref:TauD/TfdA family dioxygenase n=1 Tax=Pseudoalteromonas maricaloris TaxID=184924 RepID=UPI0021AD897A|nr:TauD/TfdA family dioxygenase [Pseudoalteromonas flavipulchra]USE71052.1 taurine catabolism dioxygenase TauD [Pseudoalteromonas flavipulchra]